MRDWDQRYRTGENLERTPAPLLVRAVQSLQPGTALDLACGAGRNAIFLAALGWRVTAVDHSEVAIGILCDRAAEAGVHLEARVADLEAGQFRMAADAYDLICDFYYLQRGLFPAIRRAIRSGGSFIGSIHMRDDSPEVKPMNPAYLLDHAELREFFRGWEILHYREGKPDEQEHKRRVAEIVARKA